MASSLNSAPASLPPLYHHQEQTAQFLVNHPRAFVTSDPGTGKTRSVLEAFTRLQAGGLPGRLLVIAPLSILEPAWGEDTAKWTPHLSYSIAYAGKRQEAFDANTDLVFINHDGVKWLQENPKVLNGFAGLCIDEFTAFKNPTSGRSKALRKTAKSFEIRWLLSGTPNSNGILNIWFPAYVCDDGERLGRVMSQFRSQVCTPIPIPGVPRGVNWIDKEGAEDVVADRLRDITIRYRFEDCIDVPPNTQYTMTTVLRPKHRKAYDELARESTLETETGEHIDAVHAGALVQKLLQLCSGAMYDNDGKYHTFSDDRYKLIGDLVEERDQCVVAFNWTHQKEQLAEEFTRRKIPFAVIDGDAKVTDRNKAVADFQAGKLRVILAHPQSAGHGLTLTRGIATIWASPTYNAEWFHQFNRRIYRAGQTRKTETILIAAEDTRETDVYEKLETKTVRMNNLLSLFKTLTDIRSNTHERPR